MTASKKKDVISKLEALQTLFHEQLPERMAAIECLWQTCCHDDVNEHDFFELQRLCHSIVGLGGTFGAADITEAARDLDVTLKPIVENKQVISESQKQHITGLIALLEQAIQQWQPTGVFV